MRQKYSTTVSRIDERESAILYNSSVEETYVKQKYSTTVIESVTYVKQKYSTTVQ